MSTWKKLTYSDHTHDYSGVYSPLAHNHDSVYAALAGATFTGLVGFGGAPAYYMDVLGAAGADRLLFRVGETGFSNGFTIAYDVDAPAKMIYSFLDGNVGIGTASPAVKMEISGSGNYNAATAAAVLISNTVAAKKFEFHIDNDGNAQLADFTNAKTRLLFIPGTASSYMTFDGTTGYVGVFGATTPTAALDVNSDIFRLRTAKTPSGPTAAGNAGDICWDTNRIYVCVATNTWKYVNLVSL